MSIVDKVRELYPGAYDNPHNGENNFILWENYYRGEPYYLTRWDNQGLDVVTLGLPQGISSELARLTTLELTSEIEHNDNEELAVLNEEYQGVVQDAKEFTEYGLALGTIILKPYPLNTGTNTNNDGEEELISEGVEVEYVTPDRFVPIKFNGKKELVHVVFIDQEIVITADGKKKFYTRLEEHNRETGEYIITNKCYLSDNMNALGTEAHLNEVPAWVGFVEEVKIDIDYNLYGFFTNPIPNPWKYNDPSGISCFATAINLIEEADEQWRRIRWEYEGSELALDIDVSAIPVNAKGESNLPKNKERMFRKFNIEQGKDRSLYSVFSPNIRDNSQFRYLNEILMKVEFQCGLAYGTLSKLEDRSIQTATEIKASKQRSFSTVTDIQKNLNAALNDLARAMAYWMNIDIDFNIVSDFDDSLVSDKDSEREYKLKERAQLINEFNLGLITAEKFVEIAYGVSADSVGDYLAPTINVDVPPKGEEEE